MKYLKQAEIYLDTFNPIDVSTASYLLAALHYSGDDVYYDGEQYTVSSLLTRFTNNTLAADVKIRFYGGPVGKGQWYWGNVYTLIADRIAAIIQLQGLTNVINLINGFRRKIAIRGVAGYNG
ncbi:MAG: hypothetical protein AMXMBFR16_11080 [Candidatus Uhrbacteria bacterium]